MPQVLIIHSSAQIGESRKENQGSYTRQMARLLKDSLKGRGVRLVERDVAAHPPGMIDASFINASRTPENQRTPEQIERLRESDALVDEVLRSDVIVVGCPLYNFGIPAPLKAWIDNIVRLGRTFTMGEQRKPRVIYGLLHNKMVVILASTGCSGYQPGGCREELNHGDKAVRAVFENLGVHAFEYVVMEGVCEDAPEEIEAKWTRSRLKIDEVARRIQTRWRNRHCIN